MSFFVLKRITGNSKMERADKVRLVSPVWPCLRSDAFVFLAGFGLWLLSHPYWGIWHDARVYTLMAIRSLNPEVFSRDPWFAYGSQDAFTSFSPLYGAAIAVFGVDAAAKWGTFLAGFSYVVATWILSRRFPFGRWRDLVFLLLVSLQLVYCINDFGLAESFRVSESFITSRQFSISFALAGIAALLSGFRSIAAVMLLVSMALHPLMGVWALLAMLGLRLPLRIRTIFVIVLLGSLVLIGLSVSGWGGFRPITGEWADMLHGSALIVFVAPDGVHRLGFVSGCYAILLGGARWGHLELQRLYLVVFVVSVAAYAVNWFCSSFLPATIIMQVQLWRANWLALVVAVVAAVDVAMRVCRLEPLPRSLAAAAFSMLLLFPLLGGGMLLVAACCSNEAFYTLRQRLLNLPHRLGVAFQAGGLFVVAILMLSTVMDIQAAGTALWRTGDSLHDLVDFWRGMLFTGGFGILALAAWLLGASRNWRLPCAIAAMLLVFGLWQWDSRNLAARQADERRLGAVPPRMFPEFIRPGDVVYWQRAPERVWFELRTASYVSSTQAIGIVFSEKMALEVARRLGRVTLAGVSAPVSSVAAQDRFAAVRLRNADPTQAGVRLNDLHSYEAEKLTIDGLRFICEDTALDFVIDDEKFPSYVVASAEEISGRPPSVWNLYDCNLFRQLRPKEGL